MHRSARRSQAPHTGADLGAWPFNPLHRSCRRPILGRRGGKKATTPWHLAAPRWIGRPKRPFPCSVTLGCPAHGRPACKAAQAAGTWAGTGRRVGRRATASSTPHGLPVSPGFQAHAPVASQDADLANTWAFGSLGTPKPEI